jgi:hypothetical protein
LKKGRARPAGSKNLFCHAPLARCRTDPHRFTGAGHKSFLLLFFKKEVLPFSYEHPTEADAQQ